MKILATCNIKAGAGKTATAVNIGHLPARDGMPGPRRRDQGH
jgi:cellulose biosynthesis protein BcsQ